MNYSRPLPFLVAALLLTSSITAPLFGQGTEPMKLTPEQLATLRDRLQSIVTETKEATFQKNTSLTQVFLQASESSRAALTFYLECIEEVDFIQEGLGGSEFRDWKERNERRLDNDEFAKGLQILLRYLAISTEAARNSDISQVFPLLTQYIDGLVSMSDPPHGILNDPIDSSIFAKRYDLFGNMRSGERDREDDREDRAPGNMGEVGWEPRPMNIGGMYEKTILPYLHQTAADKVAGAWARRIDQEGRMATLTGEVAEERFRTRGRPTLQWQMMIDQFQAGYEVSAVSKMLAHIETYKSTHPDADKWVTQVIGLLFEDADVFTDIPAPDPSTPGTPTTPFGDIKIGE